MSDGDRLNRLFLRLLPALDAIALESARTRCALQEITRALHTLKPDRPKRWERPMIPKRRRA